MFWVMTIGGALISLLAGLLPLSRYQTYLRRFFPEMTNDHIEHVRTALVISGAAILIANALIGKATIAELKERLRPRALTAEQQSHFVNTLKEGPKGTVDVQCSANSAEAWAFSRQLFSLLTEARWNVKITSVGFVAPPQGIVIVVRSAENHSARALQEAFKLVGFPPTFFGQAPPPEVLITSGLSPSGDEIWSDFSVVLFR